jgi:hypothetical protein
MAIFFIKKKYFCLCGPTLLPAAITFLVDQAERLHGYWQHCIK